MVARYLTDVEQLVEEQCWDAALRDAFDLPLIAVALTDPKLHTSGEQQRTWCEQWIGPPAAEPDAQPDEAELDYDHVRRAVRERMDREPISAQLSVPARALHRLQLRRHVRPPPRGFAPTRNRPLDPKASETAQICTALVEAARRWYARSACHDTTVQSNLARLAVLR